MVRSSVISTVPAVALHWVALILLVASVSIGCKQQGDKPNADAGTLSEPRNTPRPRLVSDKELQTLEKTLLSAVTRNKTMKCPRPVLRGKAKLGSADREMVEVIEGSVEIRPCHRSLAKSAEALSKALFLTKQTLPAGWPKRFRKTARPLDDTAAVLSNFSSLQKSCALTVKRMRSATMYGQVCSPYLPGRRGLPKLLSQLQLARLVAFSAHQLLKTGKHRAAMELLLDGIRFNQDMARGDSTIIGAIISAASIGTLVPIVELALNSKKPLGAELLKQVERELGLLVKGETHPLAMLKGEHVGLLLTMVLPKLKGPGWTPPGGWGANAPAPKAGTKQRSGTNALGLKTIESGIDPRDEWGLLWVSARLMMADWSRACPESKSALGCYNGLGAMSKRLGKRSKIDLKKVLALVKAGTAREQLQVIRKQLVDILRAVSSPSFQKYVARQGFVGFELAALRLHAAYRRLAEQQNTCPGVDAFDQPPLKSLRTNPFDNKPLRVQASGAKRYLLTPEPPLRLAGKPQLGPAVVIDCHK